MAYEDSEKKYKWFDSDEVKDLIKQYHYAKDKLMYLLDVYNL